MNAYVGAAIDSTVDWFADRIERHGRPIPISQESRTGWVAAQEIFGKNFQGAHPWNDKKGWAKAVLWESLGTFISVTGCFTGPFQFDSGGGGGFQWDGSDNGLAWSDVGARSIDQDMFGVSFDYTPSVITGLVDMFVEALNTYHDEGKNRMDLFMDMAGVTPSILAKIKRGDHNACKPSAGCYLEALAYDSNGRLVVAGNIAYTIFKYFKVDYMVVQTREPLSKLYSEEELRAQGLWEKKDQIMEIYTYKLKSERSKDQSMSKVDWESSSVQAKQAQPEDRRYAPRQAGDRASANSQASSNPRSRRNHHLQLFTP